MTVRESEQCRDCVYRGEISGGYSCDYILRKNERRRSAIGDCDKYKKRNLRGTVKRPSPDS